MKTNKFDCVKMKLELQEKQDKSSLMKDDISFIGTKQELDEYLKKEEERKWKIIPKSE